MAVVKIKDADGDDVNVQLPPAVGRAAADNSVPIVLSTEDLAALNALGKSTSATDRAGTITTGGSAQNAMAANTSRRSWTFVNNSDTLMMVRIGGTASVTGGIPVYPGQVATGTETNALSVFCTTTGKAFTAWEN